ncbi:MAG: 30S ribosome-binding factor RbfA [Bdellovibrionota bacterium]
MSDNRRVYKVAQAIREVLARRLLESSDERLRMVTITGVKVSKDLRVASVYWVQSGSKQAIAATEAAFKGARGFFRVALSEGLRLRFVPELRFFYDNTLDTVEHIESIMKDRSSLDQDSGNAQVGVVEGEGTNTVSEDSFEEARGLCDEE